MDFRVLSRNISENMHARCVREDTKQALKGILQADGVQSRQTLFVRYCLIVFPELPVPVPPSLRLLHVLPVPAAVPVSENAASSPPDGFVPCFHCQNDAYSNIL